MPPSPEQIVAKARELIGKPWSHQGRMSNGVDCGGALVWVAKELGVQAFDIEGYSRLPTGNSLSRACEANYVRIPIAELKPADVVTIKFPLAMHPSHMALVTDWKGGLGLLHALGGSTGSPGRVIEHRLGDAWRQRIASAWRLPFLVD
jgi:cell wall-associated NlpC family hydrolase